MARHALLFLSMACYVACLWPDSFCVASSCSDWPGVGILLTGWIMIGASAANATWLANPLLFCAWIALLLGLRLWSLVIGLPALAVAASFMLADTVVTNEGGVANPITGLRIGYWLWLGSMALSCVASLTTAKNSAPAQQAPPG